MLLEALHVFKHHGAEIHISYRLSAMSQNGTSCYFALSCDKVSEVEGHHKEVT